CSEASPQPSPDDFHALRQKVMDLESRLEARAASSRASNSTLAGSGGGGSSSIGAGSPGSKFSTPGLTASAAAAAAASGSEYYQMKFPSIFFLDADLFKHGKRTIPKPAL